MTFLKLFLSCFESPKFVLQAALCKNKNCNIALTRKSDVGVDVLHPVHLLQLPGQVSVHDLHLLLQPAQYMVIVSIGITISSSL